MVFAQHPHDLLGLRRLGEGGESPQVEEDHGDLAPVALERVVGAPADDRLGELRREEPLEPGQALELGHLLGHALLQCTAQLGQLIPQALDPQQRADTGEQLGLMDGLGQEVVGPGVEAFHALLAGIERGHHHDRQHGGGRVLADRATHVVAAHARHHDVEQDEVRRVALDHAERLGAGGGGERGVAARGEDVGQQLDVAGRVVDDEDARRVVHAPLARRSSASRTAARKGRTLMGLDW